ncbi:MAG: UDP-N-acetylmuramoyl-L-alanine--D-glutamate ligase, partial [Pseudoalteromonas sp.]
DASDLAAITNKSYLTNNMEEAVALAKVLSRAGNIVLLAPACASIDMYNNYMQRGDDFVECVMAEKV